jgi:predicted ATPase
MAQGSLNCAKVSLARLMGR